MLLLLSLFSRVRLCATPKTAAHQAPPSFGFSKQEHWSGLPFPSPMHESEKWKWSHSVMSNSSQPHGLQPTRLLRPWDFPGKRTGVGCHRLLNKKHMIWLKILYLAMRWDYLYLSISPLLFTSLLFTAICKASPDSLFAFLFYGDGLAPCLLYNVTNLIP